MIGMAAGFGIGMAGLNVVSSIFGNKAAVAQADRARAAEISGALIGYKSKESAINIMKDVNREATTNLIGETLRVGASNSREMKQKVQEVSSTLQAKSEGLTSGRSQGRQMLSLYVKGTKELQSIDNKTTSVINSLVDNQDKKTNELNNKLFSAYNEMATILTTPGSGVRTSDLGVLNSGLQGAAAGASLGKALG